MTIGPARVFATARVLAEAASAPSGLRAYTRQTLDALCRHIGADLARLSICDLRSGRRRVVSAPADALDPDAIAAFDRQFRAHPLVRFHAAHPQAGSHRISDSWTGAQFRRTALYADYYRRIGTAHAIAVPLHVNARRLVSVVLNRVSRDFHADDVRALDYLRGPLAMSFRRMVELRALRGALAQPAASLRDAEIAVTALTRREREMLGWVADGKTYAQVAALTGAAVRTVQKHLQNADVKLGVENRTAASMRVLSARPAVPRTRASPAGTDAGPLS